MLKTPTERPSTVTTRCVPSGKSATVPTTVTIDPEQRQRVLAEDLRPRLLRQRHHVELHRVVEVMVRPVGGEHGRVLPVVELHQRDDVAQALGLLDRLRRDVDLLHVVAPPPGAGTAPRGGPPGPPCRAGCRRTASTRCRLR